MVDAQDDDRQGSQRAGIHTAQWHLGQQAATQHIRDSPSYARCGGGGQAIFQVDKPWEAEQRLQSVRGVLGKGAGGDVPGAQVRCGFGFGIGEERVRRIVLGSPAALLLARTPPAWAG